MIFLIYCKLLFKHSSLLFFMNIHIDKNKPLLIHGKSGSGKTHVALELSKDMVLTKIDSSMLKSIKNKDYILNIVKKRNVTLMFSDVKDKRCLLIDDIHVFQKHDKFFFKMIIEFIKANQYYHTFIVMICNNNFLKNKDLLRLKKYINTYEIKYTYNEYYKKCLELYKKDKKNKFNFSLDELDNKIYLSRYNFNDLLSSFNTEDKINIKDNYDPIETVTYDLINNRYELSELFRICEGDEIILSYNMLENINEIIKIDHKKYNKIYNSFVNSDIIEYNLVKHDKDFIKYMSILSISHINYYIDTIFKDIIMNRYISKCMVLTNQYKINQINFKIYLYDMVFQYKNEQYKKELLKLDKKEYDRLEKIYNIFYLSI
ncbi:MAG: hypothetical protein CMK44_01240 [Porticoccus sp.]|nr:hypothetical protein [Porticoccus sp.]